MPVVASDIKFYLSGGAANADATASLGGAISSTEASEGVNGLFDTVDANEAAAGDIEYRCIYVKNTNGTDSLTDTKLWVHAQTSSPSTAIAIGLDPAGVNASATTVADENTAPAGVTFTAPSDSTTALALATLAAGARYAIWLRRTTSAGAAATASDLCTLRIAGTP